MCDYTVEQRRDYAKFIKDYILPRTNTILNDEDYCVSKYDLEQIISDLMIVRFGDICEIPHTYFRFHQTNYMTYTEDDEIVVQNLLTKEHKFLDDFEEVKENDIVHLI